MSVGFTHVNIVSPAPFALAAFYERVFGCEQVGPKRALAGASLERGTGVAGMKVDGVHLRLPGTEHSTLEIFSTGASEPRERSPHDEGLMHLSFSVENIEAAVAAVLQHGGSLNGEIANVDVQGVGKAKFVYARDPEGNVVEIQEWGEG